MMTRINIVVALPAEAKPIIKRYALKRLQTNNAFVVYSANNTSLVISGVGKTNAAAATAFLGMIDPNEKNAAWINIGIGGHIKLPVGTITLAHKIIDTASAQCWYPVMLSRLEYPSMTFQTVDIPTSEYPSNSVLEMEASGFFSTAKRFSGIELIQCIKVISDNSEHSTQTINAKNVESLCSEKMDDIHKIISNTAKLANQLNSLQLPERIVSPYLKQWNFSVTQRHQLNLLLSRWRALSNDSQCWKEKFNSEKSAKSLLRQLKETVNSIPIKLGG